MKKRDFPGYDFGRCMMQAGSRNESPKLLSTSSHDAEHRFHNHIYLCVLESNRPCAQCIFTPSNVFLLHGKV